MVVVVQSLGCVNSLQPHELQHIRLPCPSLSPGICSNSCAFNQCCHPTISSSDTPSSLAFSLSQHQGLFQWVGSLHQVARVLDLQLQNQSSSEYSGLIFFRIVWFDLAVQGTLKSFLQYHSSKASILWCVAFFMVQLLHPYMTTRKAIALTRWTKK